MTSLIVFPYLVFNGFSTQGFSVPEGLADKTDLFITGRDIVNFFLAFVGTIAFFVIIWAAFSMLTSAGNAEQTKKAKTAIAYAVVGIVIIAIAYSASLFLADNLSPEVLDRPSIVPLEEVITLPADAVLPAYRVLTP